ncbi:hypothetical protein PanWU01x14_145890 [Parasponia andersonii]|uniref:Uncharacterized protein n=1 Tax=Parasponia andersonii TaxID=3476 RepID=A0A2P5CKA0_PARAD|nr:hypothetical protein PanWU01x14_145890 [Parasponia andersonii]
MKRVVKFYGTELKFGWLFGLLMRKEFKDLMPSDLVRDGASCCNYRGQCVLLKVFCRRGN